MMSMRTENQTEKQKNTGSGKKRRQRRLIILAAVFFALLAVFLFGINTRITRITVTGSTRYTEEELISIIFSRDRDYNTFYAMYRDRFGEHVDIPFIEKYSVRITGLHTATVTVYEKAIAGCVEYMGSYMYFDKDGIIVESSGEKMESVPLVTGLTFRNIVMYQQLTVEDDSVFAEILNISQLLEGHELQVDKVEFDSAGNVSLYVGGIRAVLGDSRYMAGKISEFSDMLPNLQDKSGTLYLDTYDPGAKNPSYTFVSD